MSFLDFDPLAEDEDIAFFSTSKALPSKPAPKTTTKSPDTARHAGNASDSLPDAVKHLLDQLGSSSDDDDDDTGNADTANADTKNQPAAAKAELSRSVEHFLAPGAANNPGNPKKKPKKAPGGGAAGEKLPMEYVSSDEMARIIMEQKYGAAAVKNSEMDLENTSCEELEQEQLQRQLSRDTAKRRRISGAERTKRRNRRLTRNANGSFNSASLEHVDRNFLAQDEFFGDEYDEFQDEETDSDYQFRDYFQNAVHQSDDDNTAVGKVPAGKRGRKRARELKIVAPSAATTLGRMTRCFLCGWGRDEYDMVENAHMKELFRILYSNPHRPHKVTAREAHIYYMSVIYRDAVLRRQELPVWRSSAIYICMTQHKKEPKLLIPQHMEIAQRTIDAYETMKFYRTPDGCIHPHLKHMREQRDWMSFLWKLYEKDPTKMNFHRPDLNIDFAEKEYHASTIRVLQRRAVNNKLIL